MLAERVDEAEQRNHPAGLSLLIRYSLTKLIRFLSPSVFEIIASCRLLSIVSCTTRQDIECPVISVSLD